MNSKNRAGLTCGREGFSLLEILVGLGIAGVLMMVVMQITKVSHTTMFQAENSASTLELMSQLNDVLNNAHQLSCNLQQVTSITTPPTVEVQPQSAYSNDLTHPTLLTRLYQFYCRSEGGSQMILGRGCTCVNPFTGTVGANAPIALKEVFASCFPGLSADPAIAGMTNDCATTEKMSPDGKFFYGAVYLSNPRTASSVICANKDNDWAGTTPDPALTKCNCPDLANLTPAFCAESDDLLLQNIVYNIAIEFYRNQDLANLSSSGGAPRAANRILKKLTAPIYRCTNCTNKKNLISHSQSLLPGRTVTR